MLHGNCGSVVPLDHKPSHSTNISCYFVLVVVAAVVVAAVVVAAVVAAVAAALAPT